MNRFNMQRLSIAVVTSCAAAALAASANAETMGKWSYDAKGSYCSIGTNQGGAKLIMMTTKSGASGMMVVPADQNSIDANSQYKIVMAIAGTELPEKSVDSGEFGGAKVLHIPIKAARIANDMPDGLTFGVKMNDKVIFYMDQTESHDAFAAFVACSKSFGVQL